MIADELARPRAASRACRCRARRSRGPSSSTVQLAALEVGAVDVGDLELAARRRLQPRGDVDDLVVVEVEAGDRLVRAAAAPASPRCATARPSRVELDDAVALGVADGRRRPWRPSSRARGPLQHARRGRGRRRCCRPGPGRSASPPTNSRPMMKAWASPSGAAARRSAASMPHWLPSPSSALELRLVVRRGDDQDLADARQHQRATAGSRSSACRRPAAAAC